MQSLEAKEGCACCLCWKGGARELGECLTHICKML